MPTYDYKCKRCEEVFEVFQKITDAPLKKCKVCGGDLVRLISGGIGIIFKGSGFYTTDYKETAKTAESKQSTTAEKKEKSTTEETKEKSVKK